MEVLVTMIDHNWSRGLRGRQDTLDTVGPKFQDLGDLIDRFKRHCEEWLTASWLTHQSGNYYRLSIWFIGPANETQHEYLVDYNLSDQVALQTAMDEFRLWYSQSPVGTRHMTFPSFVTSPT